MDFAAHIRENDNSTQTVSEHCRNVAEIGSLFSMKLGISNISKLQGMLHDIGKLCLDFDDYIHKRNSISRGEIDHAYPGAKYILELADNTKDFRHMATANLIARTIVSHHSLHDWIDDNGNDTLEKRISKSNRYNEILKNYCSTEQSHEIPELLEAATAEFLIIRQRILLLCDKKQQLFMFYIGMLERLMQSVLIDADRCDTADFMSNKNVNYIVDNNLLWQKMSDKMNIMCDNFRKKTDCISKQRMSISDRCFKFSENDVSICQLIVPTGGGKTLSSMRFAINYCKKNNLDKIIYIAPFMSILEQNADVIKKLAGEENFIEHHSNFIQNIDTADELDKYELHAERWDKPVIATTFVQFLNSLYNGKTSSVRRMHRLCRAVIIIDEVQAIPPKCIYLFTLAMNFLAHICGSTVVLCSATQPTLEKLNDFPIKLDKIKSMTGDFSKDFKVFKRTDIINLVRTQGYSCEQAAEFAHAKFLESNNLLFIANTKASALAVFENIKEKIDENTEIIHISTNMCPKHRRKALEDVREKLKHNKPVICVTTQLIEAGVDISFKCVIRSLAGVDSITQAAGRCNRNGENDICSVYVLNIKDENLNKLKDISDAQDSTRQIMRVYDDLSDFEAAEKYFDKYFSAKNRELLYPVQDSSGKTNMIKLLSNNIDRIKMDNKVKFPQAFAKAGKLFSVIEENTYDIIAPYDEEGEDLILTLNSDLSPNESLDLIRKAQKYIVSVYPYTFSELEAQNAVFPLKSGGVALKKEFYDDKYGLMVKGNGLNLIMY